MQTFVFPKHQRQWIVPWWGNVSSLVNENAVCFHFTWWWFIKVAPTVTQVASYLPFLPSSLMVVFCFAALLGAWYIPTSPSLKSSWANNQRPVASWTLRGKEQYDKGHQLHWPKFSIRWEHWEFLHRYWGVLIMEKIPFLCTCTIWGLIAAF